MNNLQKRQLRGRERRVGSASSPEQAHSYEELRRIDQWNQELAKIVGERECSSDSREYARPQTSETIPD